MAVKILNDCGVVFNSAEIWTLFFSSDIYFLSSFRWWLTFRYYHLNIKTTIFITIFLHITTKIVQSYLVRKVFANSNVLFCHESLHPRHQDLHFYSNRHWDIWRYFSLQILYWFSPEEAGDYVSGKLIFPKGLIKWCSLWSLIILSNVLHTHPLPPHTFPELFYAAGFCDDENLPTEPTCRCAVKAFCRSGWE